MGNCCYLFIIYYLCLINYLIIINYRLVIIAMEAMDQLLVACHAQTLNLFVVSFLKMVQKLLESADPQLQILATQSVSIFFYLSDVIECECFYLMIAILFSLFALQTSKKIHHRIIADTISSSLNSPQCVTTITAISQLEIAFAWLE